MKNKCSLLLLFLTSIYVLKAQEIKIFDFDDLDISNWTLLDEDKDGNNWKVTSIVDNSNAILEKGVLASWSYVPNVGAVNPDNWVISPPIDLSSYVIGSKIALKWEVKGLDPYWTQEKYAVYIGESNNKLDLLNSKVFFTESLPEDSSIFSSRFLDLSAYAGKSNVYIAFRHYDTTDQFALVIDNVKIELVNCIDEIKNVSLSNISTNSAIFSWVGISENYQLKIEGQVIDIHSTMLPVSLTGFYSGLAYEYFVRGKCSENDFGEWYGPFGFSTLESINNVNTNVLSSTSVMASWNGIGNNYDIIYGLSGFLTDGIIINLAGNASYEIKGLDENTGYDFYVRSYSEGVPDRWYGPYSFKTYSSSTDLDYTHSFEDMMENSRWTVFSNAGSNWEIMGDIGYAKEGDSYAACYSDYNDSWFFSRGINLEANKPVTVSFYTRAYDENYPENLKLIVANNPKVTLESEELLNVPNLTNEIYKEYRVEYTPKTSGIYYLGFQSYSDNGWYLLLDNVSVVLNLGIEELNLLDKEVFQVYPNPIISTFSLVLSEKYNLLSTKIILTDISGRVIKKFNISTSYDVSDIPAGIYIVTVSDGKNKESKKIIKR